MADEKQDAGSTSKGSGLGFFLENITDDVPDEAAKWLGARIADQMGKLPPSYTDFLVRNADNLRRLKWLRLLVGGKTRKGKIANRFISEFFDELHRDLKAGADSSREDERARKTDVGKGKKPSEAEKRIVGEAVLYFKLQKAASELGEKEWDYFDEWLSGLSDEDRQGLYELAAAYSDAELKAFVRQHVDRRMAQIRNRPKKETRAKATETLTYLQLRHAIYQDPRLKRKVAALSQCLGPEKTARFWKAVEVRIRSLEDFRTLVAMSDDEISAYLKLDSPGPGQTVKGWLSKAGGAAAATGRAMSEVRNTVDQDIRATGIVGWSDRLRQSAEAFSQGGNAPVINQQGAQGEGI